MCVKKTESKRFHCCSPEEEKKKKNSKFLALSITEKKKKKKKDTSGFNVHFATKSRLVGIDIDNLQSSIGFILLKQLLLPAATGAALCRARRGRLRGEGVGILVARHTVMCAHPHKSCLAPIQIA